MSQLLWMTHTGIHTFSYMYASIYSQSILKQPESDSVTITNDVDNNQIVVEGYSTANHGGIPADGSFKHYFYATIQSENKTVLNIDSMEVRSTSSMLWAFVDLNKKEPNLETVNCLFGLFGEGNLF